MKKIFGKVQSNHGLFHILTESDTAEFVVTLVSVAPLPFAPNPEDAVFVVSFLGAFFDDLSKIFDRLVTLNSEDLFEGGTNPSLSETSNGSASCPPNHSSAVNAGVSPMVSGYRSSWNSSD